MANPKLKGQRLGQVVYNVLEKKWRLSPPEDRDCNILNGLFYISDKDLVKLINEHLEGLDEAV